MCDFINIITPLTVNDLFDYVNNILLLLFYCFSKLRETISYRSVENIMPRILYGSLDQGNVVSASRAFLIILFWSLSTWRCIFLYSILIEQFLFSFILKVKLNY